jgi:trehalose-phosphatase
MYFIILRFTTTTWTLMSDTTQNEPKLLTEEVVERLRGNPLLLLFDIDGTLAPLALTPEAARIPDRTRRALESLAAQPDTYLALVTGRGAADARRMLPDVHVWIVGNHGYEFVEPDGRLRISPHGEEYREAVARAAKKVGEYAQSIPGLALEDKTWTLSLHYRLADPSRAKEIMEAMDRIAHEEGLRLTGGKTVIELRPPAEVNKGTAVLELAEILGGLAADGRASMFFVGDDVTDEDAFMALRQTAPGSVTIRVADSAPDAVETKAEFVVRNPEALLEFLEILVAERNAGDQGETV